MNAYGAVHQAGAALKLNGQRRSELKMESLRLIALSAALLFTGAPAWASCEGRTLTANVYDAPVCIPDEPKRIVTLDPLLTLGVLLELDAPVVGTPLMVVQDAGVRAAAEQAGIVDLGNPWEPSLERVVALKPDLILGGADFHGQMYESLASIAPTVLIEPATWKDYVTVLAEIVGQTDQAENALRAYEDRAASIKERMPDITVSVIRIAPHGLQVYPDGPSAYAPYAVLHDAGVKRSRYEIASDATSVKRPDWEEISQLDGDVLLYVVVAGGADFAGDAALDAATVANPFWQMLPAVQAGRAHRVDRATWMGFHGVASAHRVLDDIERFILAKP